MNYKKEFASFRLKNWTISQQLERERSSENFKVRSERKSADAQVERREFQNVSSAIVGTELKNKMVEKEKMSKLFTRERRIKARADFDQRVKYNLAKSKLKKKELQKKYYDYDFKPKINKSTNKRKKSSKMNQTSRENRFDSKNGISNNMNATASARIQRNHFKTDSTITEVSGTLEMDSSQGGASKDFGVLNSNLESAKRYHGQKENQRRKPKSRKVKSKVLSNSKVSSEGYAKHHLEPTLELDISSAPHFKAHAMAPHSQISQITQAKNHALTNLYTQGSLDKTEIVGDSNNYQYSITQLGSTESIPFHMKDSLYKHPTAKPKIQKSHMPKMMRVQTGEDSDALYGEPRKQVASFISTKRASGNVRGQRVKNSSMNGLLTSSQDRPPTFGEEELANIGIKRDPLDDVNQLSFKRFQNSKKNSKFETPGADSRAFVDDVIDLDVTNLQSGTESEIERAGGGDTGRAGKKGSSPFQSLDYFDAVMDEDSNDARQIISSEENNQMEVNM